MTDFTADDILNKGQRPAGKGNTTRPSGQPVPSENTSVTAGQQGPVVLNDIHLIEKLAHFNRERVPERTPHAKGHGAFGELHITEDVSAYTKAKVFQKGTVTPMMGRFSTVAGEQGSPDTWRDVHGFALRFYTEEGNLDIVGNNTPVFFVRDGQKFPDFIHSQKRLGTNGLRDADMQWDFWTRNPESAHQVTYLMGDRGLPRSWRHMNGYGSHTYMWVNASGEKFWVKYHFHTQQGVEGLTNEAAGRLAGEDAEFHRRDLFDAIARGDHPQWKLTVQVMPYEEAKTYRFNPFDLTKVWSKKDYPLHDVGYFVLNRNPRNFFAQIEPVALDPSNIVPGVGLSPDKMLQARVFAYADQQRYRIGPNYKQLPVNQPQNVDQVNTYEHEGPMQYLFNAPEDPVYSPNRYEKGTGVLDDAAVNDRSQLETTTAAELYINPNSHGSDLVRAPYVRHAEDDDFVQARDLYENVYDDAAKERLVTNITNAMAGVSEETEERVYEYWTNVHPALGQRVREVFAEKK